MIKILDQSDRVGAKSPIFDLFSQRGLSAIAEHLVLFTMHAFRACDVYKTSHCTIDLTT